MHLLNIILYVIPSEDENSYHHLSPEATACDDERSQHSDGITLYIYIYICM